MKRNQPGNRSVSGNGMNNRKKAASNGSPRKEEREEKSLRGFLVNQLRDIYWAEKHLLKAIPKMEKAATTEELRQAFSDHHALTEEHVSRLEDVFSMLNEKTQAKKCEAMEGITAEAETIINETEKGSITRDAALIVAAQKVEHYEIATYGSLAQLARTLGEEDAAEVLAQTLEEEKKTDKQLTDLAEEFINESAVNETEEELENAEEEE